MRVCLLFGNKTLSINFHLQKSGYCPKLWPETFKARLALNLSQEKTMPPIFGAAVSIKNRRLTVRFKPIQNLVSGHIKQP